MAPVFTFLQHFGGILSENFSYLLSPSPVFVVRDNTQQSKVFLAATPMCQLLATAHFTGNICLNFSSFFPSILSGLGFKYFPLEKVNLSARLFVL